MKYFCYLFMAIIAFSTNAYASQPKIEIFEQFDALRMVAFISKKDINNSHQWGPVSGDLPLTIGGAMQAVKDFTKNPDIYSSIKEIELRPVPKHEKYWHYLIKIANDDMKTKYSIYVVLMSGKVIPALIEPAGYK